MQEQGNLTPRYIKTEVEVKIEAMAREIIKIGIGQITDQTVGIEVGSARQSRHRFEQSYRRNFRDNSRGYSRQDSRGE